MGGGSGKVAYNSQLQRKGWMAEGLLQAAAKSFWAPYKGTSFDSIITVVNDISKKAGHEVIFDFDGNLSGKAIKGNSTAKGKGEQKKKFSDNVKVSDYRYVVDNGTKFDGVNIGDLKINEHSDSRTKLADLWIRSEDQAYFDLAQQTAQFGINLTAATFDAILEVEEAVKNGTGYDVNPAGITTRLPLTPFKMANGDPVWIWMMDVSFKRKFLSSTGIQSLLTQGDFRGNENRLFKGALGRIGNFIFVEAPVFMGTTTGAILTDGYYNYDNNEVEIAGLRKKDKTTGKWQGETGYVASNPQVSRSVILGASAFQKANGLAPDYKWEATDFDKFSESCLEVWCGAKATKLLAENADQKVGKVAGYSYSNIFVDIEL